MKVALQREDRHYQKWAFNPHVGHMALTHALPFFRSFFGTMIHRVRSGTIHRWKGEYSHTSVHYWCGGGGFIEGKKGKKKGEFFAELPDRAILCATCEGRAIGAGLDGVREINGRRVLYSPRI